LHRFRDTAFNRSKTAIFWLPLLRLTSDGGVPLGRSPYNFYRKVREGQATKWRRNIAENFNRLSRVHKRYRQTDRRTNDTGSRSLLCCRPSICLSSVLRSMVTLARPPTPRSSLKITNRSFRYAAHCLWNEHPTDLREPRQTVSCTFTYHTW